MSEHKYKRDKRISFSNGYCYVVAFDPGGTTGWTVLGIRPDALLSVYEDPAAQIHFIDYGEIGSGHGDGSEVAAGHPSLNMYGENVAVTKMLDIIDKFPRAAVVFEDFILDPKAATMGRELLTPVRLIAAFSYGYHVEEHKGKFFVQNRSLVKTTCTNERLKNWGLFEPHPRDHIRDATRHAFYFLRQCFGSTVKARENRWRAWPHLFADPMINEKKNSRKRPAKINPRIEGL